MQDWGFYMPTRIRFGWGRFNEIRQVVDELNGKRAFLVTAKDFPKQSDTVERALQKLQGLPLEVFAEVEENPSIETVDRGAARCREAGCDLVIGLGGGSALDAAKVIAMLQRNPGSIREYLDLERVCQTKGLPVMAIPTTAGTGSEVTPFSVITHKAKRAKPAIAPPQNFPDVALVDPELTMSMPPSVTASTGLDALCQAVEGFWSTQGNPVGAGKPRGSIPAQGQGRRYPHDPREPSDRDRDVKHRQHLHPSALVSHHDGLRRAARLCLRSVPSGGHSVQCAGHRGAV
jgi:alcohol dehydrogenase